MATAVKIHEKFIVSNVLYSPAPTCEQMPVARVDKQLSTFLLFVIKQQLKP
jgi:hypothetical protein